MPKEQRDEHRSQLEHAAKERARIEGRPSEDLTFSDYRSKRKVADERIKKGESAAADEDRLYWLKNAKNIMDEADRDRKLLDPHGSVPVAYAKPRTFPPERFKGMTGPDPFRHIVETGKQQALRNIQQKQRHAEMPGLQGEIPDADPSHEVGRNMLGRSRSGRPRSQKSADSTHTKPGFSTDDFGKRAPPKQQASQGSPVKRRKFREYQGYMIPDRSSSPSEEFSQLSLKPSRAPSPERYGPGRYQPSLSAVTGYRDTSLRPQGTGSRQLDWRDHQTLTLDPGEQYRQQQHQQIEEHYRQRSQHKQSIIRQKEAELARLQRQPSFNSDVFYDSDYSH